MDHLSKEARSQNMSRVRNRHTSIEQKVRKSLYARGIRYRLHSKIIGAPDIVISKKKVAIFVNGCFWHGHQNCRRGALPKINKEFWAAKIAMNIQRDQKAQMCLKTQGWKVIVIWGCELRNQKEELCRLNELFKELSDLS